MNNAFHEKRSIFFLLLGLLIILLVALYIVFLLPLRGDLKQTQQETEQMEIEVEQLQKQIEKEKKQESKETYTFQELKKMPLAKEIDQLVLTLEELEATSGSLILNAQFSYDGSLPELTTDDETNEEEQKETDKDDKVDEKEEFEKENSAFPFKLEDKPEKLQPIMMQVEMASPDYEHFIKFIGEVEKLERITIVNALEFNKPAERDWVLSEPEQYDESITYTVDLLTFYYDE